jgi:FKBP-type peptidyl-prolyl cis-trans isomerase
MAQDGDFVTGDRLVTTHINLDANGTRVWSTYEPLQPFSFVLNQQPMIDGFYEVIFKMRAGDRMMAVIPSHLGYGESGNGPIPPNALLHFDIEVLNIQ